jgi:hypothetical protein
MLHVLGRSEELRPDRLGEAVPDRIRDLSTPTLRSACLTRTSLNSGFDQPLICGTLRRYIDEHAYHHRPEGLTLTFTSAAP